MSMLLILANKTTITHNIRKHTDIYLSSLILLIFIIVLLCLLISTYKKLSLQQENRKYYGHIKLDNKEREFMLPMKKDFILTQEVDRI